MRNNTRCCATPPLFGRRYRQRHRKQRNNKPLWICTDVF
ncbi:hypothetical protein STM474_1383 [Salmonella enterica subsp. enterica serovar Typhimurium str. ST4/74]|uniref:Uncharacterized protein n=1 Tax=Salmonella typhimurium (strain 4/74) TaxID=909946 RepID=E8XH72_SALT4|nr:hypothetical protein STM474_1383 [Salmonella enterica subsp. enterica serovar Typhimurium str. ST4/74]